MVDSLDLERGKRACVKVLNQQLPGRLRETTNTAVSIAGNAVWSKIQNC